MAPTPGLPNPLPARVAILRALRLGDLLCAVPAFRALRSAFPDAHIALIGLPWAREFVRRYRAYFDEFIEFPGHPALGEREPDLRALPRFLDEMQCRSFDLAMQMHGAGEITNVIVSQFGATAMAGFYRRGNYCPDPTRFVDYPDFLPERRRHLRLLSALGVEARGEQLEFPIEDADRRELAELFRKANTRPSASVCIHPGATDPARRWRAEHFAAVGDALAGRGLRVVLTGTEDERELVGSVKAAMAAPAVDLSGKTSLGALAALLASCRLVVSNDTGTAHLADALGTPSVVIFRSGDSEVERWAPVDRELHRVMSSGDDPVAVVDAAGELLQEAPVHAA